MDLPPEPHPIVLPPLHNYSLFGGQNHERHPVMPPPPPAAAAPAAIAPHRDITPPPPQTHYPNAHHDDDEADRGEHDSGDDEDSYSEGGSEHDHDGDEDDDTHHRHRRTSWQPIYEDKSLPCEDELEYIKSVGEKSATDHDHWARETFKDLDDPEITPSDSGRIDWLVERFNGTETAPSTEKVRYSDTVMIGGWQWRIKFYPRGNHSDYLSVYLENVTMQAADFEAQEDFQNLPFPILAGEKKLRKQRSCAAQLSVVMYNPAEPRTHEHQIDAHRFTKDSTDYGWTRFNRFGRRDFHHRIHGQRQAILRDDKLAFVAYIRVINDPTGCLWAHGHSPYNDSVAMTGLRPWSPQHPQFAAFGPLLHFAPFRDVIYRCTDATNMVAYLQKFLRKMLSRVHSDSYGLPLRDPPSCDPVTWLARAAQFLQREIDPGIVKDLIGSFEAGEGTVTGSNRLKTKDKSSIQTALDAHQTPIFTSALLTLELERQHFDRSTRQWEKLTNKVDLPNHINVRGTKYTLFAFSTHLGALTSNKFNFYVRPSGPQSLWYGYSHGRVTCLTHKQAVEKHIGADDSSTASTSSHQHVNGKHHKRPTAGSTRASWRSGSRSASHIAENDSLDEVAQMAMYIRDDVGLSAFRSSLEEHWDVPPAAADSTAPLDVEGSLPSFLTDPSLPDSLVDVDGMFGVDASVIVAAAQGGHLNGSIDPEGDVAMSDDLPGDEGNDLTPTKASTCNCVDCSTSTSNGTASSGSTVNATAAAATTATKQTTIDHFGRDFYTGTINLVTGSYEGQGHLIRMSGDEYTGAFHAGQPSGTGTMTYAATGNVYTGTWQEGLHHGTGTLTEASTGNVFEGGWKEGKKHGQFVLRGTVTEEDKGLCSICYERELNTVFYDCGHVVACRVCANELESCPVCRRRVLGRVELFGVKVRVE